MTVQYVRCDIGVAGLTGLVCKLLQTTNSDSVAYTSDVSYTEQTNAVGQYVFAFTRGLVIPRNPYRVSVVDGSNNLKASGFVFFTGVDEEIAEGFGDYGTLPRVINVESATLSESSDQGIQDILTRLPDQPPGSEGGLPVVTENGTIVAELDSAIETAIESAAADAATLVSRITSGRAANLDNLDVAVSVIQSQITALNNLSAKANWFGSLLLEVPDSSTRAYVFELVVKDDEDKLVNLDGSPTIALVNAAGTDRSALITSGIANPSTGRYTLTVTVGTDTVNESLKLTASGTVSGEARYAVIAPQVVDYDNATQVALLLTRIGTPSVSVSADIAAVSTKLGTPAGASVSADIASVKTDTGTTIPGLFTTLTTKIRKFFQLSLRKDAAIATDNATELTEINANGGSGGGGFLNTTDSQEATVDRGNVAWTTGGGGGDSAATMLSTTIATVTSQTELTLVAAAPDNDVYNGMMAVITDATISTQKTKVQVTDYIASTKTLILSTEPGFTVTSGDSIAIIAVPDSCVDLRGPGEDSATIQIKDDGVGVSGVSVWVTDDPDGVNVIAGALTTNDLGIVRFLLTNGASYYLWAKKTGKISINGRQFTAEADA